MECFCVGHSSKRDEHCGFLFIWLGIMTLHSQWYVYNCVIQVKKSMANLSFTRDLHGLNTRDTDKLDQPYCHLSKTANSFPNMAIKVYNSMRMEIKSQPLRFLSLNCPGSWSLGHVTLLGNFSMISHKFGLSSDPTPSLYIVFHMYLKYLFV